MKRVTILGATGSIGLSTLDVIQRNQERYRVVALTAHRDVERMTQLCRQYHPVCAAIADPDAADKIAARLRDEARGVRDSIML